MRNPRTTITDRRNFLRASAGLLTLAAYPRVMRGDERPKVTRPRATSGDTAVEPDWEQRLTITVGPQKAQLIGGDQKVIQAAVDYVARLGGGTVRLLPGLFKLRNAVYLQSKVRLLGSGDDTVLLKNPSVKTKLAEDSDWYDQEITLEDAKGFQVGDGVCLQTTNPHNGSEDVLKRTLVARSGNRFKLDRPLRKNYWLMGGSTASTLFPIITGEYVTDISIENLTLDGNRENNENLNGNYAGGIFLQDCSRIAMRDVTSRNYNGDGFSWQICHDVVVENCHSHDNAGLGLHPGSGSQRPLIRNNRLARNDIGIFFCWGVKYGLAEKNHIEENRLGVSIGHRDTDNLIRDNEILASREVGVLFRPERGPSFAGHRNRIENNRIHDSGPDDGIGIDVQGGTRSIRIVGNDIREMREPMQRIGVRIGAETQDVSLSENRIEGFAQAVADLRTGGR